MTLCVQSDVSREGVGTSFDALMHMPKLGVSDVTRIARQVGFENAMPFQIVGVLRSGPGSGYVEPLVNIDGCSSDPVRL
jgi:hypothetical protein